MRFSLFYRINFYIMLFLATLALNIDMQSDFPLAPLYPIAVVVAAVVATLTVDRNPHRGLNSDLANLLAVGSIGLSLIEYLYDPSLLVLAMGHWLVYLQIIKICLPKTVEDDWFLFLLGLTQMVVAAFQPGERVGIILGLWAFSGALDAGALLSSPRIPEALRRRDKRGDDPACARPERTLSWAHRPILPRLYDESGRADPCHRRRDLHADAALEIVSPGEPAGPEPSCPASHRIQRHRSTRADG